MDSVSSDQAIISHRHSPMHTYVLSLCTMHTLCTTPSQSCLLPFYTIPIFPLFNSKDFSFTCNIYMCICIAGLGGLQTSTGGLGGGLGLLNNQPKPGVLGTGLGGIGMGLGGGLGGLGGGLGGLGGLGTGGFGNAGLGLAQNKPTLLGTGLGGGLGMGVGTAGLGGMNVYMLIF